MREVNEAWRVLRDPEARRRYDTDLIRAALGDAGETRSSSPSSSPGAGRPTPRAATQRGPAPASRPPAPPSPDEIEVAPLPAPVRGLPWIVLLVVLGVIFVVTAYAVGGGGGSEPTTTTAVEAGACLRVLAGPTTSVIDCGAPGAYRVVDRVLEVGDCPTGTEARRLSTDGRFDCLELAG